MAKSKFIQDRQPHLRWSWRFFIANCFLFWIIGLLFISAMELPTLDFVGWPGVILIWAAALTSLIGYLGLRVNCPVLGAS